MHDTTVKKISILFCLSKMCCNSAPYYADVWWEKWLGPTRSRGEWLQPIVKLGKYRSEHKTSCRGKSDRWNSYRKFNNTLSAVDAVWAPNVSWTGQEPSLPSGSQKYAPRVHWDPRPVPCIVSSGTNSLWITPCESKKITNMVFTRDFWNRNFFGRGEVSPAHAADWRLVVGS
jgi:hypothetical protein